MAKAIDRLTLYAKIQLLESKGFIEQMPERNYWSWLNQKTRVYVRFDFRHWRFSAAWLDKEYKYIGYTDALTVIFPFSKVL